MMIPALRAAVDGRAYDWAGPGDLLVARPGRVDPAFERALILLTELSAERVEGLILNHPVLGAGEGAPGSEALGPLRRGGPVGAQRRVLFDPRELSLAGATPITARLALIACGPPAGLPDCEAQLAGYTGPRLHLVGAAVWGRDQLAQETRRGSWMTQPWEHAQAPLDLPPWGELVAARLREAYGL